MRENLKAAFETKVWNSAKGDAPRSGPGSSMDETARLRAALPSIFTRYKVGTFLDAPCGDWHWMSQVDLSAIDYIGGDISGEVIAGNLADRSGPNRRFIELDITSDPLPKADMIMVRDCLMHLKDWLRWAFLENFAKSDIPFLLTTVHHVATNIPVVNNSGFKRFNPVVAPFLLPQPLEWIPETADSLDLDLDLDLLTGQVSDKAQRSVAIWSRDQVAARLRDRAAQQGAV